MDVAVVNFAGFNFFAGFEICWIQVLLDSRFAGFDPVIEMQARGLSWSRMSS